MHHASCSCTCTTPSPPLSLPLSQVRILRALREHLRARGGTVRFSADVAALLVHEGRATGVRLASGEELRADHVVLAVGHSARRWVGFLG